MEIGNIDVFLEAVTKAFACNKVLRKKFLTPRPLVKSVWMLCANSRYSKKTLMWLLHMEQTDGCQIRHAGKDANTDLLNCCIIPYKGTVQRLGLYMNFWDATITDVHASLFAT
jgi:hypothetical protein